MTVKLILAPIPKLPANDPAIVWTVWDKQAYYLWGADEGNYQHRLEANYPRYVIKTVNDINTIISLL